MWFRVTLAKDGAIRSCGEVSASFESNEHVLYIEADTRSSAIEKARKRWKGNYRRRVYQERKSLGICTACNQPALPDKVTCERHSQKQREANGKTYEKKKALGVAPNERVPAEHDGRRMQQAEMIAARKYGTQPSGLLNLRTLLIVRQNADTMPLDELRRWLDEEIARYRTTQVNRGRAA